MNKVNCLTDEEILVVKKYQDNDYKIINTLFRYGVESEVRINSRKGKDYPYMTRKLMENTLRDIYNLYSAIIKSYLSNNCKKIDKPLYRGTEKSLIRSMQNSNSSFLSATTSIVQTMTFSQFYTKHSNKADTTDRAVLLVEGNVPWLNIEDEFGGGENEVLFVPSKISIEEAVLTSTQKFGSEYIMRLSELEVPIKSLEEIEFMKKEILDKTEKMSDYLKYILAVKDNSNFNQNPRTLSIIEEYSKWKKLVIEYNHQQYIFIKNKLIGTVFMQNKETEKEEFDIENLMPKVESEHFIECDLLKQKSVGFSEGINKTIFEMKNREFEFSDLDEILELSEGIREEKEITEINIR